MLRVEARNLAARRGEERIFSGISFVLEGGDSLVVTGRNGSGKSTLIRVVAGLLSADEGETTVTIGGQVWPRAAEACHYLGHQNAMKREMTVEENLVFWKRFMGDLEGGAGLNAADAADAMGLSQIFHLPFGYLSAGQQRRMAMAKLLCAWRPVWLLDEPTAALDVQSEALFARIMEEHLQKGGSIIAATHQPLGLNASRQLVMTGFDYAEDPA